MADLISALSVLSRELCSKSGNACTTYLNHSISHHHGTGNHFYMFSGSFFFHILSGIIYQVDMYLVLLQVGIMTALLKLK